MVYNIWISISMVLILIINPNICIISLMYNIIRPLLISRVYPTYLLCNNVHICDIRD